MAPRLACGGIAGPALYALRMFDVLNTRAKLGDVDMGPREVCISYMQRNASECILVDTLMRAPLLLFRVRTQNQPMVWAQKSAPTCVFRMFSTARVVSATWYNGFACLLCILTV